MLLLMLCGVESSVRLLPCASIVGLEFKVHLSLTIMPGWIFAHSTCTIACPLQIIVDDYMKSESVLKASRMHDELDLDGEAAPHLLLSAPIPETSWELCCNSYLAADIEWLFRWCSLFMNAEAPANAYEAVSEIILRLLQCT